VDGDDPQVKSVMAHPPVTIAPDETPRKAAALMTGHGIGSLPVVDEGKLVGIVTSYDLLALLAKGTARPTADRERSVLARRSRAGARSTNRFPSDERGFC